MDAWRIARTPDILCHVPEADTVSAQYLFLDVVGFTRNRSVEAQTDIVAALNEVVRTAVEYLKIEPNRRLFIPTGDGMCIALLELDHPYDLVLQLAVDILRRVQAHDATAADEMRRFRVRLGVNENIDNLVIDINGHRNVAGAGISIAARVMDWADGGQILVSQTVYERLRHRERYMNTFRGYSATAKHNLTIPVFQFITDDPAVNQDVPSTFAPKVVPEERLPLAVAYYIAHALINRPTLLKHKGPLDGMPATLTLWFRAKDSVAEREAKEIDTVRYQTFGAPSSSFDEQFSHYRALPFHIVNELGTFIVSTELSNYVRFFGDPVAQLMGARFANKAGARRLATDWPDIYAQFGLNEAVNP